MGDQLRAAVSERAGVVSAAAVTDQRDPAAVAAVEVLEPAIDAIEGAIRASDVHDETAQRRAVADSPQPGGQHEQGLVAAAKAREQDHRTPVPVRDADPADDRIDEKPGELERPAGLSQVVAPPALLRQRRQLERGVLVGDRDGGGP